MRAAEGLAIIVALCVAVFGVGLSASYSLTQWLFVAFPLLLLGWTFWRTVWASQELSRSKKPIILVGYMQLFVIPLAHGIRTDVSIDHWSASDWWRGGSVAAIALCTAFLLGAAFGMRKAASREARSPIGSNGAQV